VQTLTDLQQYVRQHHTTGLVWAGKANIAASGIPPPPPPSMPIGDIAPMVNDDRSALFAQINQGEDITKSKYLYIINELFFFLRAFYKNIWLNYTISDVYIADLKKVTSDMQTHKNPALRSGPAPFKAPTASRTSMKNILPANAPIDKSPAHTHTHTHARARDNYNKHDNYKL